MLVTAAEDEHVLAEHVLVNAAADEHHVLVTAAEDELHEDEHVLVTAAEVEHALAEHVLVTAAEDEHVPITAAEDEHHVFVTAGRVKASAKGGAPSPPRARRADEHSEWRVVVYYFGSHNLCSVRSSRLQSRHL